MGAGPGVLVHELPGVGDQADVQRLGDRQCRLDVEAAHEVPHDLGRARRLGHDVVDRPEVRVVMVVVDVEDVGIVALDHVARIAVDVAAVQEHDRALPDVVGDHAHEPIESEEAVFVGQRELVGGHEHHAVLAERLEHLVHGHQRPERVPIGVLVRDEDEAVRVADLREHPRARGRGAVLADHEPSSRSISSEMRMPRSMLSSMAKFNVGVCLRRSSPAIRRWR